MTEDNNFCPRCGRPLPQAGAPCAFCAEQGEVGFQVKPLFLILVLLASAAFLTGTVFAVRYYNKKQQQLGRMWFQRGEAALQAGQPQTAFRNLRDALYYAHDDPRYRLRLAEALVAANRLSEAQAYLLSLWQEDPGEGRVNLELAKLAAKQGEQQAALRYYHAAIYGFWADNPTEPRNRARLELIHYLLQLGSKTQAQAELIALTPELPRNAPSHSQVGWLFLAANDPNRALGEFQQALRLDPHYEPALNGAGQAAFNLGQYRTAVRYLERATRRPRGTEAEHLLTTAKLILSLDPYAKGLSSRQKAARVVQAFGQASLRLQQCAQSAGIDLESAEPVSAAKKQAAPGSSPQKTAAGVKASSAATEAPKPGAANAAPAQHSGIVATLLGRKAQAAPATSAQPAPTQDDFAPKAQQLYQQMTQVQPNLTRRRLERNPELADTAMGLVGKVEQLTAQHCGTPSGGADLALLLLARQGEEQ